MEVKISVIVPIYNIPERMLRKCIESIVKQEFFDVEVILIDDGSPDRSGEVCDEYSKIDKRIKVFHIKNSGVSVARNIGIENANGEFIMFVDPDDYLLEGCLAQTYKAAIDADSDILLFRKITQLGAKTLSKEAANITVKDNSLEKMVLIYAVVRRAMRTPKYFPKLKSRGVCKNQ